MATAMPLFFGDNAGEVFLTGHDRVRWIHTIMLGWINPRVVTVVASVMLLLAVTRSTDYGLVLHRSIWVCASLFVVYVLVFLLPLRHAVKWQGLLGMAGALAAGWASTALAFISDARPLTLEEQMQNPTNWARMAFFAAAGIAFYLFADSVTRGYRARAELIEIQTGRRPD